MLLVDLPPNWTNWTYATLQQSDLIVLVTQLTVSGVRQTIQQLETLQGQGLENVPLKLVMNRRNTNWRLMGKSLGNSAQLEDAEKAIGHKFDCFVADDYALVSEAINQGMQLAKIEKRARVIKDIKAMVLEIKNALEDAGADTEARPAH